MENTLNQPLTSVLVGLDLTQMDDQLIRYAAAICKILPVERLLFVHVADDLQLPDELIATYPDLVEPLDESIEADIRTKVSRQFDGAGIQIDIIVKEGHPIEKILKLSKVKHIDLIIMGRKKSLEGSGIMSSRIARKCPCSILFVTAEASTNIQQVLLPVDFSHHAALAIQIARQMQERAHVELRLVNYYRVPIGYYKTGKSHEFFADLMRQFAEKDCEAFLERYQFPEELSCDFLLSENGDVPQLTFEFAEEQGMDMIIIGSRGRTGIASMLMGSIAEKLVYLDRNIPIMIVKQKGENMGFLDTIMKL